MLLFPPQIKIKEGEGFTPENDTFNRKEFGESLARLVKHADDALVIGLDAPWGEGKTTFVKQWQGLLKNDFEIDSIYFDAFAHDYQYDPLAVLADEFYAFIDQKTSTEESDDFWQEQKPSYLEGAANWVASKAPAVGKIFGAGIGAFSAACSGGGGPETDAATAGAAATGEVTGEQIEAIFKARQEAKRGLKGFRDSLKTIGKELRERQNKPLVFIIDELDRCRPDFALDLIEKVKHVFSVPGIVFVLVYNKEQMCGHIECRYGAKVQSQIYLNKFINIETMLPKNKNISQLHYDDSNKFIEFVSSRMDLRLDYKAVKLLTFYSSKKDIALREVEKLLTSVSIAKSSLRKSLSEWDNLICGLCLIHLLEPSIFKKLLVKEQCWQECETFFEFNSTPEHFDNQTGEFGYFKLTWHSILNPQATPDERHRFADHRYNINDLVPIYCKSLLRFLPETN
ncbi:P-loop NTPase fold protein [Maridesulfovibrio sp.]|uniref:KAP family P-loop NTPase fold protein n=1 Tax=Maridesulfovibrio sp. TaxID=2795000 RepID=UPI002A18A666|nr:P-loop NTPase fold protein [Maridesulfovibrio sp.]